MPESSSRPVTRWIRALVYRDRLLEEVREPGRRPRERGRGGRDRLRRPLQSAARDRIGRPEEPRPHLRETAHVAAQLTAAAARGLGPAAADPHGPAPGVL